MTALGDILNWAAAGILFPLMLLPLAGLFPRKVLSPTINWLLTVAVVIGLGVLFAYLTPSVRWTPEPREIGLFSLCVGALVVFVLISGGASKSAQLLASLFAGVNRRIGRTVMWLLLLMALVQFAVVLMRYVFGVNYIFMQESITYMHGAVFLLAAGYALLTDDHVRVDIFYREAPEKRKAITDLLGAYLFLFPVCFVIIWAASPYVARSWAYFEGSTDTSGIRGVFLLKTLIPTFATLLCFSGFTLTVQAIDRITGRDA